MPTPKPNRRPLLLIVRDGWGHNPHPEWNHANAVHLARTPNDDRFMAEYPNVLIHTSGEEVGLPAGVMGNSEVGHQNIGAGRIVHQEIMRITRTIREGTFFENAALVGAVEHCRKSGGALHLMGLCSDGRVHSDLDHLFALLKLSAKLRFPGDRVFVHAVTDGRDTPPKTGVEYLKMIEAKCRNLGINPVASVVGRFYAMDRDSRWDRVQKAYDMLVAGRAARRAIPTFNTADCAVSHYYDNPTSSSMQGDEFVVPSVTDGPASESRIKAGDAVVFFNFRGDRPREITKAFTYDTFPYEAMDKDGAKKTLGFDRGPKIADLYYCTLTEYEKGLPVQVAYGKPPRLKNILGEYAASLGLRQFRTAETEKYPHVTFFFNDYRDEPFAGEDRRLVPSPRDVTTYDQKPEMSAREVTEEMLRRIATDRYDLLIMNYANGDMVGHSGNLAAAIKAIETVDECFGPVVDAVLAKGGAAIVTADHGNSEQMIDPTTGGPHTAHTTYDVPLILVDDRFQGRRLREGGALSDLAPTLLDLAGLPPAEEMTGRSLLRA